jgi:hypothetical protein
MKWPHPGRTGRHERPKQMNIYRLEPITFDPSSWQYSAEKNGVWACAPTPEEARALVAAKTGFAALAVAGARSPWQDATVTSCVPEPTMRLLDVGDVVRQDGSSVDYDAAG